MKCLVSETSPISEECGGIPLVKLHSGFDSFFIQSLATVTVVFCGVKTMELQQRGMKEFRLTEMQWA
jgi:hypothetical protein